METGDKGPNERSPEAYEAKGRAVGIKINRNEARTPNKFFYTTPSLSFK